MSAEPEQAADQLEDRVGHADGRDGPLVAGEVHDLAGDIGVFLHADRGQVFAQEARAARDVRRRVLRAVAVLGVVELSDVAHVVIKRAIAPSWKSPAPGSGAVRARALVAVEQAHHRA